MTIDKSGGNYYLSGNTWLRPSYVVLEVLRDTEVTARNGQRERLLDSVDVITWV